MRLIFGLLICLNLQLCLSQNTTGFYIIDSLPIGKMSSEERILLDSILNKYHHSKFDTARYRILSQIAEHITDPLIWPAYNKYVQRELINKIGIVNPNSYQRKILIKYLIRSKNNEGLNYNYLGEFDKGLKILSETLVLAKSEKQEDEEAEIYNSIGGNYHFKGDLNNALNHYLKSAQMYFRLKDNLNLALLLYNIAQVYYQKSDFNNAINFSLLSLRLSEQYKNDLEVATTSGLIGQIFYSMGDYQKAIEYFEIAYDISNRIGSKVMMTEALINLGTVNYKNSNSTEAFEQFTKAKNLAEETNNSLSLNIILNNLTELYLLKNDLVNAEEVASIGLKLSREQQNRLFESQYLILIAQIKYKQHQTSIAKQLALTGYYLSEKMSFPKGQSDAASILKEVYALEKNWQSAYKMSNIATRISDSLNIMENQRLLYKRTYQLQYEKREIELKETQKVKDAIAKEEKMLAEFELGRNRYILAGLIVFIFIGIVVVALILNQNKLKNEQRTILLEQKLLRSQMNPHFIFNSLNSIHSIVLGGDSKSAGKYLATFSKLIRSILEGSRFELISLEKEISFLKNYIELQKLRFENDFKYEIEVSDDLDLTAIALPPMLSQPFIENAIEHGLNGIESPLLSIKFYLENDFLCIEICDNGLGYKTDTKNKEHLSLATSITQERLALFNKGKVKHSYFEITEANPGQINKGVKVVLKIRV